MELAPNANNRLSAGSRVALNDLESGPPLVSQSIEDM